jgi:hypothetical protein
VAKCLLRKKARGIDKPSGAAQHCARMPEVVILDAPPPTAPPAAGGNPPAPFATWCDWARDGLAKALEGMKQAGGGVLKYNVGSRGLEREGSKSQVENIGYWNEMVKFYCGDAGALPSSLTGRDTACRIIPRDV